jgi:hypothetical protein
MTDHLIQVNYLLAFSKNVNKRILIIYRKTPLLVPGGGSFSIANSFVWDQVIAQIKTNSKISTSPILNSVLN